MNQRFGFGCMRFPMLGDDFDYEQIKAMFDLFLQNGFTYFDTAHGYHDEKSESVLRECLTSRYKREAFTLTNKLTGSYFKTESDIMPLFEKQLKACGVDYFDYYLMHSQNKDNYAHFKACHAYETALKLRDQGKIKHFGISFHDTANMLEEILSDYPQIEVVQIQLNYVDYDDLVVQSRQCLEVCRSHQKPVIVMEPVKGGLLVNLPEEASNIFSTSGSSSPASYAIRFAAGCEGVVMTLSGMSSLEQVRDNISFMKDFHPLNEAELKAVEEVCAIFKDMNAIPCTACRYCTAGCPKNIQIPDLFACLNKKKAFNDWNAGFYYKEVHTMGHGKAGDCIGCGKCEKICPQHLSIRELLKSVAKEFE